MAQLLRQLRVVRAFGGTEVLRRLVDANQWSHAEQLAVAASEEDEEAARACGSQEIVGQEEEEEEASVAGDGMGAAGHGGCVNGPSSTADKEADHMCYLDLQRAAKAATVATVQGTGAGGQNEDAASVRRVAAALGGYIKRADRLPIDDQPPRIQTSKWSYEREAQLTAFIDSGTQDAPRVAAPRAELLRSGMAIQRQLLPEVAQVMALSKGGGGAASAGGGDKSLLRLLLSLAHQRSNAKVAARLGKLVDDEGGVQAQRNSQLARLVSSGEVNLAVTFAGEDRSLQSHLVGLLRASDRADAAADLVRLRHLPNALLMEGCPAASAAASAAAAARHTEWQDSDGEEGEEGHGAGTCAGTTRKKGSLLPYALPAGTVIEVFERPEEVEAAEAALAGMLGRVRSGEVPPLLGVDAEWVVGRRVSLVQLALPGHCVLLRTLKLIESGCALPPSLAALLSETGVLKLGVGVGHDLRLLLDHFGLPSRSVVELQGIAQGLKPWTSHVLAPDSLLATAKAFCSLLPACHRSSSCCPLLPAIAPLTSTLFEPCTGSRRLPGGLHWRWAAAADGGGARATS